MNKSSVLKALCVALLSAFVVGITLLDTRIVFLREAESDLLLVALNRLRLVLGPAAILLFAFGVQWATQRRFGRALLALPALPIWSLVLIEVQTYTSASAWASLFLAHSLRGLQPFGGPLS